MRNNPFRGYGVALVTPFLKSGNIDYDTLENLIEFQIQNGADFICALGTTAETPTLNDMEYQNILNFISAKVAGRIPIMVGCSDNCTKRLADKLQSIDFADAKGILSCVPAYNKPSQEGIYAHFAEVAKASPLPIVLYNVPGRTGVNMTADTTLRIASSSEKFIAIKEASGNVQQIKEILDKAPDGFQILSGDDSLSCQLMEYGVKGVISVIGNAIPKTFGRMIHLLEAGQYKSANEINQKLSDLYSLLFKEGNPSGIKALMSERNLLSNTLRLPMVPVSPGLQIQIKEGFTDINI